MSTASKEQKSALIVGASRGLGLAIVQELLERGWNVTGTVRSAGDTPLHALAGRYAGRLSIEHADINEVRQIAALKARLAGKSFDLLFVNAGVANDRAVTIGEVSTEDFVHIMVTNALSTMRVVEQLTDSVRGGGTVGVMSSGQGSLADNERGGFEIYRASKAALNQMMKSFAIRKGDGRTYIAMSPGWVRTEMGGDGAPLDIETSAAGIAETLIARSGAGGIHFIDFRNQTLAW